MAKRTDPCTLIRKLVANDIARGDTDYAVGFLREYFITSSRLDDAAGIECVRTVGAEFFPALRFE
ncbi:MAG TPA: hypothetical protein PKI93_06720 [Alphaproteobacteria bacterium]|nr:hypothetical protein [Alphaproteobacteria bacterium]